MVNIHEQQLAFPTLIVLGMAAANQWCAL